MMLNEHDISGNTSTTTLTWDSSPHSSFDTFNVQRVYMYLKRQFFGCNMAVIICM
jgi:hypothetical protein